MINIEELTTYFLNLISYFLIIFNLHKILLHKRITTESGLVMTVVRFTGTAIELLEISFKKMGIIVCDVLMQTMNPK